MYYIGGYVHFSTKIQHQLRHSPVYSVDRMPQKPFLKLIYFTEMDKNNRISDPITNHYSYQTNIFNTVSLLLLRYDLGTFYSTVLGKIPCVSIIKPE